MSLANVEAWRGEDGFFSCLYINIYIIYENSKFEAPSIRATRDDRKEGKGTKARENRK